MKIGLAQMACALGDVRANLEKTLRFIAAAREEGVELLILPELSLTGYSLGERAGEAALRLDDEMIQTLCGESGDLSLVVGLVERAADCSLYNTALYLEEGEIKHVHRKLLLPTYGIFEEMKHFAPGKRMRAFDTRWGRMAILICADCWSPALAYVAAMDRALLLIHIAATPAGGVGDALESEDTWEGISRLYARLYTCYVAFVNRVGTEGAMRFWGGSELINPRGEVVVKAPRFEEKLACGEVDWEEVYQQRLAVPLLRQERPGLVARELQRIVQGGSY